MLSIETKSGRGNIINKDKIIKQKLIQSLSGSDRYRLELYKETNIPLTQFFEKKFHMRTLAKAQSKAPVRKVEESNTQPVEEMKKGWKS